MLSGRVPALRVSVSNDAPVAADGDFVLYWMIAARRLRGNFALDRALDWAAELGKPLLVFEPLRVGYAWASDRLHRFVIEGMRDNALRLAETPVAYYPYVEPSPDADKGLLAALAQRACVVVTDDYPCFFLPRMVRLAAARLPVRVEAIDSNGLLPLRAADQVFPTAYAFRRFLQKTLPEHLQRFPQADPLRKLELPQGRLPREVTTRWPAASKKLLEAGSDALAELPIDHAVGPAAMAGGADAAHDALRRFVRTRIEKYATERNQPEEEATSGLSAWLHFGHIGAHEVFSAIMKHENWSDDQLGTITRGQRAGWWGTSETAEGFLDQLVTWRELGFNMAWQREDYDQFESLPDWAQRTLAKHARDPRTHDYSLAEFAAGATHDRLWNAAQRQLASEGRMHNYLRMLWGKKIVEWSPSPREALDVMIELNNRYAVDGRDPNSYSGIFWVLGRYDRPWGPERPVFGTVRWMSSENTARKVSVEGFIRRYSGRQQQKEFDL